MEISELYEDIKENNVDMQLVGDIELNEDGEIKWSYDGLGAVCDNMQAHLAGIHEEDMSVIEEFINDNKLPEDFVFLLPEIDDTYVSFHIVEA